MLSLDNGIFLKLLNCSIPFRTVDLVSVLPLEDGRHSYYCFILLPDSGFRGIFLSIPLRAGQAVVGSLVNTL